MCACVLHTKWLWVSVWECSVVTFNHSDVENGWFVGLEEGNSGKKWLPQDHRSLTHISSLISERYDHAVAALLTLVPLLFQLVITVKCSVVFALLLQKVHLVSSGCWFLVGVQTLTAYKQLFPQIFKRCGWSSAHQWKTRGTCPFAHPHLMFAGSSTEPQVWFTI